MMCMILDCRLLSDPAVMSDALDAIGPERRAYALSYVFDKDRRLSAGVGLMMRSIEREFGVRISKDADGCPHTDGGVHVSFSHSGDYAVGAVSDRPVGIDIEAIGRNSDIYPAVMTPEEHRHFISDVPDPEKDAAFCRMWTAKESYMKAMGKGLGIDPASFRSVFWPEMRVPGGFTLDEPPAPEGYRISVCHDPADAGPCHPEAFVLDLRRN